MRDETDKWKHLKLNRKLVSLHYKNKAGDETDRQAGRQAARQTDKQEWNSRVRITRIRPKTRDETGRNSRTQNV